MDSYEAFLAAKDAPLESDPVPHEPLSAALFPHQHDLVTWALRRGRAGIYAATGLGKSRMELEWAAHVVEHTNKPVLILTPLAVAPQMVEECAPLGREAHVCRQGSDVRPGINVTNYERLHLFDPSVFGGVVTDEASCVKHHDAKRLGLLLSAFGRTRYRLAASATPCPNDWTELGTQAEFLGICTRMEMLAEYFVHDGGSTQDWRLKGHARDAFWRFVATWGAFIRHPRDLGYDTDGYDLPPLEVHEHVIGADYEQAHAAGLLIPDAARTLSERRAARRGSLSRRVQDCAALVNASDEQWVIWCDLNAEADALAKAIPGAVEVRGSDDLDVKEERLHRFATGQIRVLITKARIAGWGCNWQAIRNQAFVGISDSFESLYQAIRRSWRFGQKRSVQVHLFTSELEGNVLANLKRKERDAELLAESVSEATREAVYAEVRGISRLKIDYAPTKRIRLPRGLVSEAA